MTIRQKERLTWWGKIIRESLVWAFRGVVVFILTLTVVPYCQRLLDQSVDNGKKIEALTKANMLHLQQDSLNDRYQAQVNENFASFVSEQRASNKDNEAKLNTVENWVLSLQSSQHK